MFIAKILDNFLFRIGTTVVGLVLAHYGNTALALIGGTLFLVALLSGDLSDMAKKPLHKPVDGRIESFYEEEDVTAFFAEYGLFVSKEPGPFGGAIEISDPKTHEFVNICMGRFQKISREI